MTTTIALPASVISDGMVKTMFVHVMGDPAHPGIHELLAGSGLDTSCYLTDSGWAPAVTEETAADNRLCSRKTFNRPGRNATTLPLSYVYNPFSPEDNEAQLTLLDRVEGFWVARWGKDFEDPFVAGDIVDVWPVQFGVQMKQPGTANTPLVINQTAYVIAPGAQLDVVVTGS